MRVHVVSDVHGAHEALAAAGEGADALICLGDLILFLDYSDHARGIFPELFGAQAATRLVELRTARRFDEAREMSRRLWAGMDREAAIEAAVRKQYAELFAAFPTPANAARRAREPAANGPGANGPGAAGSGAGIPVYATYGNVDIPELWPEFADEGTTVLDGETAEIGGRTFGFVGGGLRTKGVAEMRRRVEVATEGRGSGIRPERSRGGARAMEGQGVAEMRRRVEVAPGERGSGIRPERSRGGARAKKSAMRTPYEIDEDAYAAKVAALGPVDVLCSHIPPAVPDLTYDVVARRFERGSEALLDAIRTTRPAYALFGHVHQPLAGRMRIGTTECVNVGHFRATGQPWVLEW